MKSSYILAIDQGTSSTKTLIFDETGTAVCKASEPLRSIYPQPGYVEQDPEEIFQNVLISVRACLQEFVRNGKDIHDISACGISNQRETFVLWNKEGKPLHNALVWQCKRSIGVCESLKKQNLEQHIRNKTGLLVDPYFSGTKLIWLYQNDDHIRSAIDRGEAFFGTVDTWLLYKLTGGKGYFTDFTNASRTLLFNLATLSWDSELLKTFGLSTLNLPECKPSSFAYGDTDFMGALPFPVAVTAMIGDSHAAAFGEGCFTTGTAKATMGTGCSVLMNVGQAAPLSESGMVSTICWSTEHAVHYALEGVIVSCGATLEWLKNELGLFIHDKDIEGMARTVDNNGGVYLVPAFSGLGAPYWDMNRRASIEGLTFSANKNHIIRAALESIPFQIKDVIDVMEKDAGVPLSQLMIDGGITSNGLVVELLKDLLQKPVINIGIPDVSALGAAYLAGLKTGLYGSIAHLEELNASKLFHLPSMNTSIEKAYEEWKKILEGRRS